MTASGTIIGGLQRVLQILNFRRFQRSEDGATAVEFSIVATPFFMFIFALIGFSFFFFNMNSIEMGMDAASRLIRTGQATANSQTPLTVDQFKQKICDGAGRWINCNNLQVFAQHWSNWVPGPNDPPLNPSDCVDSNSTVIQNSAPGSSPIANYTGTASDIVIVTTCYKWDFASKIPFLKIGNMPDGSMMMQTATAFRSEPYPGN